MSNPEPTPFEKLREAVKRAVAVPKAEILRREAEYRKQRKALREAKKASA